LANAKVKVCTAAEAQPAGANLQLVVVRDVPLMVGMPLTADDIPGLEAQGADGIVALVSRRPNDPKVYLLRNRSRQPWTLTDAEGKQRKIESGLGI
jgi:Flp pilus assembly protein CpaB